MRRLLIIIIATLITFSVISSGEALAHPAWGIVVDRQGQVYFSALETIWKIDAQGRHSVFRAGVSGRHTHELNIDESGNIYGEELTYESSTQRFISALWKMTPAGGFSYILAPTSDPPRGMSIWKDSEGSMYLTAQLSNSQPETALLKRTPDGKVITLFGSKAVAGERQVTMYGIGGMAFGPDGSLYFADGPSIRKLSRSGGVTTLLSDIEKENPSSSWPSEGSKTRFLGIAVDAQSNVLAVDFSNQRLLKIAPDGKFNIVARAEQPWMLTGVAVRNDELYTLENEQAATPSASGTRVRKLNANGQATVLAVVRGNENPPAPENPPGASPQMRPVKTPAVPYAWLGAGAGILALTLILWFARYRTNEH